MALQTRPLHPLFGVEITGLRLGSGLLATERQAVHAAVEAHGVAVLRGQDLSDEDLGAFAMSLGETWRPSGLALRTESGVFRLSNIAEDGGLLAPDDRTIRVNLANELWHTDGTFRRPGASISMLHARVIPPEGGDTEYCDTRVAHEALDAATQARLEGLIAHHSFVHSRAQTDYTDFTPERRADTVPRPLVHDHVSGRRALCLASHIGEIEGLEAAAAAALLARLHAAATAPDRIYTHRWTVGDVLMWDNRCTMHRARPFPISRYPRDMRSVRLVNPADL